MLLAIILWLVFIIVAIIVLFAGHVFLSSADFQVLIAIVSVVLPAALTIITALWTVSAQRKENERMEQRQEQPVFVRDHVQWVSNDKIQFRIRNIGHNKANNVKCFCLTKDNQLEHIRFTHNRTFCDINDTCEIKPAISKANITNGCIYFPFIIHYSDLHERAYYQCFIVAIYDEQNATYHTQYKTLNEFESAHKQHSLEFGLGWQERPPVILKKKSYKKYRQVINLLLEEEFHE